MTADQALFKIKKYNPNEDIKEIINELTKYNPLELLRAMKIYFAAKHEPHVSEIQDDFSDVCFFRSFRYIHSLYMSKTIKFSPNPEKITLSKIENLIGKIGSCCQSTELCLGLSNETASISDALIKEHVHGRTYICFASPLIVSLLSAQRDLLQEIYNIEFEEIEKGIFEIARHTISLRGKDRPILSSEIFENLDSFIPTEDICIESITSWPSNLIRDLSYEMGEAAYFFEREKYPGWFDVEMPILKKPFFRINNKSYCLDHNICFDCLYRAFQKAVHSKGGEYITRWKENQTEATEELTGVLLEQVFCSAKRYNNFIYKIGKKEYEGDGVLVFDNAIIYYEVKSGAYTPDSILINPSTHQKSQKSLIYDPISQCKRFCNELEKKKQLSIYNETGELITTLKLNSKTIIIPLAVSLEQLGELSSTFNNKLNGDKSVEGVIPISIQDLMVYCNFFDSPLLFLHFLRERKRPINQISLSNNEELNYLAYYLSYPNYSELMNDLHLKFDNKNISNVILSGEYEEIDAFFAEFPNGRRPAFSTNPKILQIIYSLEKCSCSYKVDIANILLDMDQTMQIQFIDSIKMIIERQLANNKFSTVTLSNPYSNDRIQVFCNGKQKYVTNQQAHEYTIASLKAQNLQKLYYVLLELDEKENIKTISANKVTTHSDALYAPGYFDPLITHMRYQIENQLNG